VGENDVIVKVGTLLYYAFARGNWFFRKRKNKNSSCQYVDGNFVFNITFDSNQIEVDESINDVIAKKCKEAGRFNYWRSFLFSKELSPQYQKLREANK
jgi:hypothetical protein